ncbi:MAG: 2-oxo-4-hydroxy-4-carboxy-5-ureidoimidazoline decarboxylase, partial [Bdellovibrionota bacterium]
MAFAEFCQLSEEQATAKLLECCHSAAWARAVAATRVRVKSLAELQAEAEKIWAQQPESELLAAFSAHPKIGDVSSLKQKYASTKTVASGEQSGVGGASDQVLEDLAHLNQQYERKHGFIFIVFATGKSASEMLALLEARIG